MLASVDPKLAVKAEKAVDSFFFRYVEAGPEAQNGLVTIKDSELAKFEVNGQTGRRLNFKDNSLALKALKDG